MAECQKCGKRLGLMGRQGGLCWDCHAELSAKKHLPYDMVAADAEQKKAAEENSSEAERAAIDAILLTTETAPNLPIAERIEIVTAECAIGMSIFKDLFAGVRDIVGGRSRAVQATMRDARRTALFELKREAWLVGADAVVGVDLDYVELSSAGSMVMLVASGTAVRLARPQ